MPRVRCRNGTRKNKVTGKCESIKKSETKKPVKKLLGKIKIVKKITSKKRSRCPNGTKRDPLTGECKQKDIIEKKTPTTSTKTIKVTRRKRCPNGTKRNPKTGECVSKKDVVSKKKITIIKSNNTPLHEKPSQNEKIVFSAKKQNPGEFKPSIINYLTPIETVKEEYFEKENITEGSNEPHRLVCQTDD